ncbi:MAG: nuclear transport factor 2 family protein [Candidatus Binatia bacterium]
MNLEELKSRLETLEAIEAIKKLKARYCQCADERDAEGYANLFTEDGVFEGGAFGRGQGRAGVAAFLRGVQQQSLPFALHYVMNPIIEVHGDTATGQWYLLEPCTMVAEETQAQQAVWGTARYEEEYVKVAGEWQFTHLKVFSSFMTPYEQGWAKKKFV